MSRQKGKKDKFTLIAVSCCVLFFLACVLVPAHKEMTAYNKYRGYDQPYAGYWDAITKDLKIKR